MPIPKLNFSTGNVVDPTKGALQGVTAARNTLTNSMNQWAKEEELARQAARQKVQDDRATTTYNQQQQELTDRQKFGQAMLGDRQMQYADANAPGSEIMSRMKNVELTPEEAALSNQGIETPAVAAKLKAQMELGQQFDSTGVRETEWDKLQRVARETGTGGSLGVQEKLYSAKAADAAARKAEETKAVAAKQKLVDEYNTKSDKLTDLLPTKRGHYGSTKTALTGKSSSSKDWWAAEDAIRLDDLADSTSVFGYFGDTEDANKPITYAKSIGLSPKETESVLVKMSVGPEGLWKDEKLRIPGKPEATDSEIQEYAREQMDTLAKSTTKSSGASGGFYNKEDNSSAIVKVKAEMKSLEKKINNFGSTDYSDDRSAGAKSMDKMNALAKKLWSELPAAGEEPKKGSAKTTNTNLIPGKIGTAMSLKAGDGAVAKFASNPETAVEFAREYELLKPPQQARVDNVLDSDASKKVYDAMKEDVPQINTSNSLQDALASNKPLAQFPAQSELSPGALDILRQLNPTGMTDQEKMMAQFEAEDRPLEDMSLMFIPGLKAAKTTASQLKILTKAGYTKAKAEALIKSGRLKLLPERPSQINVPRNGFTKNNLKYDISMPAMKP